MRVADRVSDVTERMQTRRLESKRESLDRDNERLRTELRTTKSELDRERSARDELLEALKKGEGTVKADKVKVKTKKRGGFLRLLIVGGGAYVLGTRAGRERFEQMKGWASDMKDRMRGGGSDADEWAAMSNGGSGATSGMSGTSGSATGSGSTAGGTTSGSGSSGSTSSGSGSTSTGSTTGSGSTPSSSGSSTGTGSSGSTSTGSKRSGSSGTTSGSSSS